MASQHQAAISILNVEDMLLRTVQAVEMHNLMELLPVDVLGWWEERKRLELANEQVKETEAMRFFAARMQKMREHAS